MSDLNNVSLASPPVEPPAPAPASGSQPFAPVGMDMSGSVMAMGMALDAGALQADGGENGARWQPPIPSLASLPVDRSKTDPTPAYYKLQFGDEVTGFSYYVRTLAVMIGRNCERGGAVPPPAITAHAVPLNPPLDPNQPSPPGPDLSFAGFHNLPPLISFPTPPLPQQQSFSVPPQSPPKPRSSLGVDSLPPRAHSEGVVPETFPDLSFFNDEEEIQMDEGEFGVLEELAEAVKVEQSLANLSVEPEQAQGSQGSQSQSRSVEPFSQSAAQSQSPAKLEGLPFEPAPMDLDLGMDVGMNVDVDMALAMDPNVDMDMGFISGVKLEPIDYDLPPPPPPPPPPVRSSAPAEHVDVDLGPLKSVSRNHAKIEYRTDLGHFCLEIYGRNGAWVDDRYYVKGSIVPLAQGSQIQIATRIFSFVLPPSPVSSPTYTQYAFDHLGADGSQAFEDLPYPYNLDPTQVGYQEFYGEPGPGPSSAASMAARAPPAFNAFAAADGYGLGIEGVDEGGWGESWHSGDSDSSFSRSGSYEEYVPDDEKNEQQVASKTQSTSRTKSKTKSKLSKAGLVPGEDESELSSVSSEPEDMSLADKKKKKLKTQTSGSSKPKTKPMASDFASLADISTSAPASLPTPDASSALATAPDQTPGLVPTLPPSTAPGQASAPIPVPPGPSEPVAGPTTTGAGEAVTESKGDGEKKKKESTSKDADGTPKKPKKKKKKVKEEDASKEKDGAESTTAPTVDGEKAAAAATAGEDAAATPPKKKKKKKPKPAEDAADGETAQAAEKDKGAGSAEGEDKSGTSKKDKPKKKKPKADKEKEREKHKEKDKEKDKTDKVGSTDAKPTVPSTDGKAGPGAPTTAGPPTLAAALPPVDSKPPIRPSAPTLAAAMGPIPQPPVVSNAKVTQPNVAPSTPSLPGQQPVPPGQPMAARPPMQGPVRPPPTQAHPGQLHGPQHPHPPGHPGPHPHPHPHPQTQSLSHSQGPGHPQPYSHPHPPHMVRPPYPPGHPMYNQARGSPPNSGATSPQPMAPFYCTELNETPGRPGHIIVNVPIPPSGAGPRPPPGPILGLDGKPFIGPPPLKPTSTFATIIHKSLQCLPRGRGTLGEVCNWVAGEWEWFRLNVDSGWQNSIRHNLSLNKAFLKVPRIPEDDPESKGSVWIIDPEEGPLFEEKQKRDAAKSASKDKNAESRREKERIRAEERAKKQREAAIEAARNPQPQMQRAIPVAPRPLARPIPQAQPSAPPAPPAPVSANAKGILQPKAKIVVVMQPITPAMRAKSVISTTDANGNPLPFVCDGTTLVLDQQTFGHLTTDILDKLTLLGAAGAVDVLSAWVINKNKQQATKAAQAAQAKNTAPASAAKNGAVNGSAARPGMPTAAATTTNAGATPRPGLQPPAKPTVGGAVGNAIKPAPGPTNTGKPTVGAGGKPLPGPAPPGTSLTKVIGMIAAVASAKGDVNTVGPNASALLRYIRVVGVEIDLRVAERIWATGVVPPLPQKKTVAAKPAGTTPQPQGAAATNGAVKPAASIPSTAAKPTVPAVAGTAGIKRKLEDEGASSVSVGTVASTASGTAAVRAVAGTAGTGAGAGTLGVQAAQEAKKPRLEGSAAPPPPSISPSPAPAPAASNSTSG